MFRTTLFLLVLLVFPVAFAQSAEKLTGRVIGTAECFDYSANKVTTTVNTAANAFDGDLSTFFATNARSRTWCGLDLGKPHVITRVGWSPRNDGLGPGRVQLAVFEGANRADFSDALPLYLTMQKGTIGQISYADLSGRQAFRYVRYVGPNDARCNVAEVEFYGYAADAMVFDPAEGEAVRVEGGSFYRPTNLPLVVIHTENAVEPYDKEHEIPAIVTILSDEKLLTDTATVRLRGNGSMPFPKKPYRIKWDEKHHVLGSPAKAKKWTLINNYGDKTLMRNMLAFDLSRRFNMPYTPFCTPVDVMVNGEYKGCYQLCDQVEVHKNRVDIEEMDASCISMPNISGGYFIEIDAYASSEPVIFSSFKNNPVTIKSPDSDVIQKEQRSYVAGHYNQMEKALFSPQFTSPTEGYRQYLDVESFLRHFLIGELSGNTDTYWSVYLYKPRLDDLFHCGPVWDFDLAFENDSRTHPINSKTDWVYRSGGSCAGQMRNFVDRIVIDDVEARELMRRIWADARCDGELTEESLLGFVDECADLLQESQRLNFMRWPILSQNVHMNYTSRGSYSAEVNAVKDYLKGRLAWMDRKLNFDPSVIGIANVEADESSDDYIYTLSGRRAELPLHPGVYIRKGQKLIIK